MISDLKYMERYAQDGKIDSTYFFVMQLLSHDPCFKII